MSDIPAEQFWQQQFGQVGEVPWTDFWKSVDALYPGTRAAMSTDVFRNNVSAEPSDDLLQTDFLNAAGKAPMLPFLLQMGGSMQWSRVVGFQGKFWTDKVISPLGTYITDWEIGTEVVSASVGPETIAIEVLVYMQGKSNNDIWLPALSSPDMPTKKEVLPKQAEGYSKLTGKSGGWLTNFLGCGGDRDPNWTLEADNTSAKVVGYQLRLDGGVIGGARFLFAGPGWWKYGQADADTDSLGQWTLIDNSQNNDDAASSGSDDWGDIASDHGATHLQNHLSILKKSPNVGVDSTGPYSKAVTIKFRGQDNSDTPFHADSCFSADVFWPRDSTCCLSIFNFNNSLTQAASTETLLKAAHLRLECKLVSDSNPDGVPVHCRMEPSCPVQPGVNVMALNSSIACEQAANKETAHTLVTETCHTSSQTAHYGTGTALSVERDFACIIKSQAKVSKCHSLAMSNGNRVLVTVALNIAPKDTEKLVLRCTVSLDVLHCHRVKADSMLLESEASGQSFMYKIQPDKQGPCQYEDMAFVDIACR